MQRKRRRSRFKRLRCTAFALHHYSLPAFEVIDGGLQPHITHHLRMMVSFELLGKLILRATGFGQLPVVLFILLVQISCLAKILSPACCNVLPYSAKYRGGKVDVRKSKAVIALTQFSQLLGVLLHLRFSRPILRAA